MKRERVTLFVLLVIFATSLSQDSWETYEDSEEYYEYEEPIDLEEAKQYFCSEIKEGFKNCCIAFYPDVIENSAYKLLEKNRLDKYDSCFEKIGLKSESFLEAVDEACLPETPVDVGKKFQACKIEIQMEWKKQNVSLSPAPKLQGKMSPVDIYITYCLPVREKLLDEGWLQYFLAGVLPL